MKKAIVVLMVALIVACMAGCSKAPEPEQKEEVSSAAEIEKYCEENGMQYTLAEEADEGFVSDIYPGLKSIESLTKPGECEYTIMTFDTAENARKGFEFISAHGSDRDNDMDYIGEDAKKSDTGYFHKFGNKDAPKLFAAAVQDSRVMFYEDTLAIFNENIVTMDQGDVADVRDREAELRKTFTTLGFSLPE